METPRIIFEDEFLLALNKPAGMVVNDAESVADRETLQSFIEKNFDFETAKSKELRSGIVHRLDKETSGVILVAKTKDIFEKLQKQFFERNIEKKYLALVHGEMKEKQGMIDEPVGRLPKNRRKFGVLVGGREAQTEYSVTEIFNKEKEKYTLVELQPKTGRTHQIRIHLKHLGYAIVSDPLYAGRKTLRKDLKWCPRLFLHASEIKFLHPVENKEIGIKAELAEDLKKALEELK